MNGHFVIMYKATTETGKTFHYYSYLQIGFGNNMMNIFRTINDDNGIMKFTIEVNGCFPFQTKKKAVEVVSINNEGANKNGTGLNAFLKEIDGES